MFERIVVAVDGSEPAKHALAVACDLAGKYGSDLHLIHSPQIETTAIAVGAGAVEIRPDTETIAVAGKRVIDQAEALIKEHGCTPTDSTIGTLDPTTDILNAIEKVGADLVIMGRRGLGSVSGLFLGSVSQKVSHGATCTCMTVS